MSELVALGHQHKVLSLVDAAQSIGAIELDLPASGVDFYAMPGQKWLCGPEGTGALYVRPDRLSQLNMTFTGFFSMKDFESWDFTGNFMPAPGAKRFEVGTVYRPGIEAMSANLAWLAEDVGWTWIFERIEHLHHYARQALSQLKGVNFITPPGPNAGLLSFTLGNYDPMRVMTKLLEDDIVIRFLGHPYCLRVSTGFYNTETDIDRLVTALQEIETMDPDSLPTLEW
jgi:L-cysteine/cystine lyase